MNSADFLREQFITLRDEIKESKARIYRTMGFGIVVVPAANFLAQTYRIEVLLLSVPLLVIVVALMYLSENHALMRCGRYIRLQIEPRFHDVLGWEKWLEIPDSFQPRSVDKYVGHSFYILFFVYFAGSVFVADHYMRTEYGMLPAAVLLGLYIAVGVWFLIYLFQNIKISTATVADGEITQRRRSPRTQNRPLPSSNQPPETR